MVEVIRLRKMLDEAIELWGLDDVVTKMIGIKINKEINKIQKEISDIQKKGE